MFRRIALNCRAHPWCAQIVVGKNQADRSTSTAGVICQDLARRLAESSFGHLDKGVHPSREETATSIPEAWLHYGSQDESERTSLLDTVSRGKVDESLSMYACYI